MSIRSDMVKAAALVGNATGASRKWKTDAKRRAVDCSHGIVRLKMPAAMVSFKPDGCDVLTEPKRSYMGEITIQCESVQEAAQMLVDAANAEAKRLTDAQ